MRLHAIGEPGVWVDEANSILGARRSLAELLAGLRLDSSPPLFYLVLQQWMRLVGDGAIALRLLSAACGVALVVATFWSGRALMRRDAGLVAAAFVACSPVQVHHSQQVRMYALLALLALVSSTLLVRHLRDGGRRDLAGWLVSLVLALYTHNFAVYLVAAHGALVALSGSLARAPGRWLAAAAIGALAYAPWLPSALAQLGNRDHYAWFAPYWELWGAPGVAWRTLLSWSPGGEYLILAGLRSLFDLWHGVPALAGTALAVLGARTAWRARRAAGAPLVSPATVLACWPALVVLVPMALSLLVSALGRPNYVPSRVDQMMLPAFALLVGQGAAALRPAALRSVAGVAIVVVGTASTLALRPLERDLARVVVGDRARTLHTSSSEAEQAARIASVFAQGDAVLFTSLTRAPLEYYLRRRGIDGPFSSFPRETARHLGAQNDARWLADPRALRREAVAAVREALGATDPDGRLILVRSLTAIDALLEPGWLERRFALRRVAHLGYYRQVGTNAVSELLLYERADTGAGR